ncbi:hypothetical protein RRG08_027687 [Elysia crispata]|uniref:Uncharacterized protein n=1 Tax=Elysia crispata TaxID=231223 RepID=A0AAE0XMG6_9GAST|nr:hypothetical protein RRG08_027687 [Elysia crispata]
MPVIKNVGKGDLLNTARHIKRTSKSVTSYSRVPILFFSYDSMPHLILTDRLLICLSGFIEPLIEPSRNTGCGLLTLVRLWWVCGDSSRLTGIRGMGPALRRLSGHVGSKRKQVDEIDGDAMWHSPALRCAAKTTSSARSSSEPCAEHDGQLRPSFGDGPRPKRSPDLDSPFRRHVQHKPDLHACAR